MKLIWDNQLGMALVVITCQVKYKARTLPKMTNISLTAANTLTQVNSTHHFQVYVQVYQHATTTAARTQLGIDDVIATAEEMVSLDAEAPSSVASTGSIEDDVIAAHLPAAAPADSDDVTLNLHLAESDDEQEAEPAPPRPSSRQMLDMMPLLLESASGNDACLTRAQDLLIADIVRGKIAA